MATGTSVIERALTKLGIRAAESPVTASEIQDGLDQLNDMLSSWENSGLVLGFQPLENASDTLRVPRHALAAIKANLAIFMAPEYGRVVSEALAAEASNTKNELRISLVDMGEVNYPNTLPLGSGNECTDFNDQRYFPADQDVNF